MTFPVVGSNIPSAYQISNSLRFNDNDSAYLTRTFSSAGNRKTWTFSCWVKLGNLSAVRNIFSGTNVNQIRFNSDNSFFVYINDSTVLQTNALYRDTASWYHIIIACDTTQSTASNRTKLYVNGTQITSFATENQLAQNTDTGFNNTTAHTIGRQSGGGFYYDGYMAEINFIDGQQLSPTDFGEFDEDSGVWKPKQYAGTYGTNGFYLKFNNTGNMGEDSSGNDNTFTPVNLSGTTDVTTDTPTNNFATVNALDNIYNPATLSEGNLRIDFDSGTSTVYNTATVGLSKGKWYWEVNAVTIPGYAYIGIAERPCQGSGNTDALTTSQYNYGYAASDGNIKSNNSAGTSYGDTYTSGDIIGVALDLDNNKLYVSKNGTWQNSANPSAGTGGFSIEPVANVQDSVYYPAFGDNRNGYATRMDINFGNPSYTISSGNSDVNGYGNMEYAVPTGFSTICTQNLATALSPTIDDGSQYFNTVLYTGDGSADNNITGVGFQPDWVWGKNRVFADAHWLLDSSRGATKGLYTNGTAAEVTQNLVISFDTDGFSVGNQANGLNTSSQTYVAWNWKANGGTTSSNTDGDITTTVQANTTSGFSILTWTGNGTASQSLGHGLGVTPKIMIQKNRNQAEGWQIFGSTLFDRLQFDTGAEDANFPCTFSSTTITLPNLSNNNGFNSSGDNFVSYVFAEIEGYSKFGSYTGNGSTDGTFIYTGFRPAWILFKQSSAAGENWRMFDNKRNTFNQVNKHLFASSSSAESTETGCDFLSNGFKFRHGDAHQNASGATYIYMAFAENPFVTSGATPVTAR